MMMRPVGVVMALLLITSTLCYGQLQQGFYAGKCKTKPDDSFLGRLFRRRSSTVITDVEQFVADIVRDGMKNGTIDDAALLRLQFHDCFVNGCDASILLDSDSLGNTAGKTEKDAGANGSVRGYEFIDAVKARLEEVCPGVVSCADIIVLATRDAVNISTSSDVAYKVKTGRKDGVVSAKSSVNLPSPFLTVPQSIAIFENKLLSAEEMVILLGAHTVGKTRCSFVKLRLYSATPSPAMNKTLETRLKSTCPNTAASDNTPLDLDHETPQSIDNAFFRQLRLQQGLLDLDQALSSHPSTSATVKKLAASSLLFNSEFAKAMVKLGEVNVLTKGQIRKSCRAVN